MKKLLLLTAILSYCLKPIAQTTLFNKMTGSNTGIYNSNIQSIFVDKLGTKYFVHAVGVISILKNNKWDYIISNNIGGTKGIIDSNGTIWLTGSGLTRIIGKTVQNFNTNNSGLKNNVVNTICMDKYGVIYIGSNGGLIQKFDGTNWIDINYINNGQSNRNITDIKIDKDGVKWAGTSGYGIVKFNDTSYTVYNTSNSNIPTNIINIIAIDTNNNKWLSTNVKGIVKYNNTTWSTLTKIGSQFIYNELNSSSQKITCMKIDSKNRLCIGYSNNGLQIIGGNAYGAPLANDAILYNWNIPSYKINDFYFTSVGELLVATDFGAASNSNVENYYNPFSYYDNSNTGLTNGQILSMNKDKNNKIWIGLGNVSPYDNQKGLGKPGLSIYNNSEWQTYNNYNSPIGKPLIKNSGSFVSFVLIDSNENIWIPGSNSILRYNGNIWKEFNATNSKYTYGVANCMAQGKDGTYWIGTDNGLVKFNGDSVITVFNNLNSNLPSNKISLIFIDNKNNIWLAGNDGLIKFDGTNFVTYNTSNSNIKTNTVFQIKDDKLGNLWISTRGAIQKFNGTTFSQILTSRFNWNDIESIYIDSNNTKWFGYTNGAGDDCGIGKIADTTITIYNNSNSNLPKNLRIYSIIEGDNSQIWFANRDLNNSGIYTLNKNSNPTGMKEWKIQDVVTYPNPVKDRLYIDNILNAGYRIINLQGQIIDEGVYEHGINVSHLQEGLYIISVNMKGSIIITKFIKN